MERKDRKVTEGPGRRERSGRKRIVKENFIISSKKIGYN